MLDATVVAADISRLVQNSPHQRVLGSELAVLLKRGYPDFKPVEFGCRNLRDFVRRYAKTVFEEGKKGTDVLYSAASLPALSEVSSRQQEFNSISSPPYRARPMLPEKGVWKTFVSPNALYRLYANRESGEMRVLTPGVAALSDPWVIVPPCPAQTHLKIAREFLDGMTDEAAKTQLTKILDLDSWWDHFFFSARNFGVERQWSAFRRRRLHDEFQAVLRQLGIPGAPAREVSVYPVPQPVAAQTETTQPDSAVKRAAIAVIRRLSDTQLRELSLPLGHVLDAMEQE